MQKDYSFLQMALVGYKAQRQMIDEKIADIQKLLGRPSVQPTTNGTGMAHGQRRPMSAAAKRRIAAAQKKRWKAFHAKQGMSQPKAGASAKRLAALKKARAARAAKRAASKT